MQEFWFFFDAPSTLPLTEECVWRGRASGMIWQPRLSNWHVRSGNVWQRVILFVFSFFFRSGGTRELFKALAKTLTPVGNPKAEMIDGRPPRDLRCILNKGSLQMTDLQWLQMRKCTWWERLILTRRDIQWAATLFGTPCYYRVPSKVASECCYSFKVGGGAHSEMNDDSHTCGCSRCFVFVFSEWLTFCGLQPFWPLTPDTNEAFSSIQLPPSGYFLFFRPFSVNPRDGCDVVKIPGG